MIWKAQPGPQTYALQIPDDVNEILFGGARGGGKTDTGIVWMSEKVVHPLFRGLVIRKNSGDLQDWVDRATRMYQGLGVKVAYRPWELTFPSGAKILTGHLKDRDAYTKYQGQEFQRQLIEELTQIPDEMRYLMLKASCRSTVSGIPAQVFSTANPGGVGHTWVKKRFIDVAPYYSLFTDKEGLRRVYVPATIDDNPALYTVDPDYVRQLDGLRDKDPDLWKAWRRGDWNIIAGQAFREWNPVFHVTSHFDYPLKDCKKFIGFDWGYNAPGVAVWIAVTPENKYGVRRIYVYRELWLTQNEPREWAKQFKMLQKIDGVRDMWLPHDCFNKEMGESIAEIFRREGNMNVRPANTLKQGARHMRKAILHSVLNDAADGRPLLQLHTNCVQLASSIPELITSETDPEDIDTEGNDHGYDALTEALMMEVPHLGKSSGIRQSEAPVLQPVRFMTAPDDSILPPDIMDAVKQYQSMPARRPVVR